MKKLTESTEKYTTSGVMAFPFQSQFVDWGSVNADVVEAILSEEERRSSRQEAEVRDRIAGMAGALLALAGQHLRAKPQPRSSHRTPLPCAEPMQRE